MRMTMISWTSAEAHACEDLIRLALAEDLGDRGDLTSALLPEEPQGRALLKSRTTGVLAGLPTVEATYRRVGPGIQMTSHLHDGQALQPGAIIATITGPIRTLLSGERTALNFLQRLSG